jgi:hypothetical protein
VDAVKYQKVLKADLARRDEQVERLNVRIGELEDDR